MPTETSVGSVAPAQAQDPLVLALDVGTSSVRAILYDALGRAVEGAEAHVPYQMDTTPDGGVEIDARRLLAITSESIDGLLPNAPGLLDRTCGVACSTFWHSLMGVSAEGEALTPLYSWNDTRSRDDAAALAQRRGVDWVHSRTGAVPHASYYPAKLLWLRRTKPAAVRPHLVQRLHGVGHRLVQSQHVCLGTGDARGVGNRSAPALAPGR
jgi:gluconokinase